MAAIGKFVLWGKENLCLIRPHGDSLALETLFFAEDVRSRAEIEEAVAETDVQAAELELAQQVIQSLVGEFQPEEFENHYRGELREMLEAKVAGQEIKRPEPVPETPVVDLMEALRRSVQQVRGDEKPKAAAKSARRVQRRRQEVAAGHGVRLGGAVWRSGRPSPGAVPGTGSCRSCPGRSARPPRPRRELKAFTKVALSAGATSEVRLSLTAHDLSYWSVQHRAWVLEGGDFDIAVGASSRDLPLASTVTIDAPPVAAPLNGESTLEEWLADPNGRAALEKAVGTDDNGHPAGIVGDAELKVVIGNFPLRTLLAFPGLGIDRETYEAVTGEAP